MDVKTDETVGALWYNYQEKDRQVFIYEIWMDPEKRKRGMEPKH
ncbi:hypothetical protein ACJROX_04975 [Pseudalkalibacillus sp. A8]